MFLNEIILQEDPEDDTEHTENGNILWSYEWIVQNFNSVQEHSVQNDKYVSPKRVIVVTVEVTIKTKKKKKISWM